MKMSKKRKKKCLQPKNARVNLVRAVGIAVFFLPCALYFACTMFLFPVPANSFLIIGLFAAFLLGIPCMLFVGILEPGAFGVEKTAVCVLLLLSLPCIVVLVCACLFLYLPTLQSSNLEGAMSDLLFNAGVFILCLLFYGLFRQSAKECLRLKGHSKSFIRKSLHDSRAKLLFRPFRQELGILYRLNFFSVIGFAIMLLLTLSAMFWNASVRILKCFQAMLMILLAVMVFLSGYDSDFRLLSSRRKEGGASAYLILCIFLCYLAVRLLYESMILG